MGTSYGLIEVSGVVAAIDSLDAMCKASDVSLVTWERKLGGRLVTLIVEGGVSDVKAAVDAAKNICEENKHILAACGVIAAPSGEIRKMVALSARRIQKNKEAQEEIREKQEQPNREGEAREKEEQPNREEEAREKEGQPKPQSGGSAKPSGSGNKNHRKK